MALVFGVILVQCDISMTSSNSLKWVAAMKQRFVINLLLLVAEKKGISAFSIRSTKPVLTTAVLSITNMPGYSAHYYDVL